MFHVNRRVVRFVVFHIYALGCECWIKFHFSCLIKRNVEKCGYCVNKTYYSRRAVAPAKFIFMRLLPRNSHSFTTTLLYSQVLWFWILEYRVLMRDHGNKNTFLDRNIIHSERLYKFDKQIIQYFVLRSQSATLDTSIATSSM